MSSSTGLNGFRRTASAPEVRSRSPSMSAPVSKITWGERAERLSSRQNESPSSPGRLTSRITTSGRKNRAISAAASAESASSTSNSLAGSVVRRSSRRPASSSTRRTRSRAGSGAVTAAIGGDLRVRLKAAALSALARSARSRPPAPEIAPRISPTITATTNHSTTPTKTHVVQLGISLRLLSLLHTHVHHAVSRSESPPSQYGH